jgi:hypothetical protein
MTSKNCKDHLQPETGSEVVELSDAQKKLSFKQSKIAHTRIAIVLKKLMRMILPDSGFDIVLLIGPTGVGKTAALTALESHIENMYREEMAIDRNFIPAIKIEIPEPGPRQFAYSSFYKELLSQLNDPLSDKKVETVRHNGITSIKRPTGHTNVAALHMALKGALVTRRTRVVIIDEAAHLLGHVTGNDLINLTNALKSLANVDTRLVLAGSYDLLKLATLNAQLSRRTRVIHFERYGFGKNNSQDEAIFRKCLEQLQNKLPTKYKPNFLGFSDAIHRACFGCIGILKQTFQRALESYLNESDDTKNRWTMDHFQDALLPLGTMNKIREETIKGEKDIQGYLRAEKLQDNETFKTQINSQPTKSRQRTGFKPNAAFGELT